MREGIITSRVLKWEWMEIREMCSIGGDKCVKSERDGCVMRGVIKDKEDCSWGEERERKE